jgi:cytochrome P450
MSTAIIDETVNDSKKYVTFRAAADAGSVAVGSMSGLLYVLHYAEIETLINDPRLAGVGLNWFDHMSIEDSPLRRWYGQLMFTTEGDIHNRLRRLVSRAFTPRSVALLRDTALTIACEAIVDIEQAGEGDLVEVLSYVPMRVMCQLLGVPDEVREQAIISWTFYPSGVIV